MVTFVITFVVVLIVVALLLYVLRSFPLPGPLNKAAEVAIVVIGVLVIVAALLSWGGVVTFPVR